MSSATLTARSFYSCSLTRTSDPALGARSRSWSAQGPAAEGLRTHRRGGARRTAQRHRRLRRTRRSAPEHSSGHGPRRPSPFRSKRHARAPRPAGYVRRPLERVAIPDQSADCAIGGGPFPWPPAVPAQPGRGDLGLQRRCVAVGGRPVDVFVDQAQYGVIELVAAAGVRAGGWRENDQVIAAARRTPRRWWRRRRTRARPRRRARGDRRRRRRRRRWPCGTSCRRPADAASGSLFITGDGVAETGPRGVLLQATVEAPALD
jgi:hypothetical protein